MEARNLYFVISLMTGCTVYGHIIPYRQDNGGNCSKINLITRAQWGARAPKHTVNLKVPVPEFFVHHTDTAECFDVVSCSAAVRNIQDFHMDYRGWNDIAYNFLVGEDGNVYEGRGWAHVGSHTKYYNSKSLGASVIGDYMEKLPNQKALTALSSLINCAEEKNELMSNYKLYGHRDAGSTTCPGDELYKLIQTWPHYSHSPPETLLFQEYGTAVGIDNL